MSKKSVERFYETDLHWGSRLNAGGAGGVASLAAIP